MIWIAIILSIAYIVHALASTAVYIIIHENCLEKDRYRFPWNWRIMIDSAWWLRWLNKKGLLDQ